MNDSPEFEFNDEPFSCIREAGFYYGICQICDYPGSLLSTTSNGDYGNIDICEKCITRKFDNNRDFLKKERFVLNKN